jgi:hypothetical protein
MGPNTDRKLYNEQPADARAVVTRALSGKVFDRSPLSGPGQMRGEESNVDHRTP